jgi:N-acetylglutamate synthase-like GNAT family acetyltransferase
VSAEIRPARANDLPELLELLHQLATSGSAPAAYDTDEASASGAFAAIDADPSQTLLVAEDGGSVVGTLHLVIVPNLTHHAKPWAIVENIVVNELNRGAGLGRALLEEAVRRAVDAGCYKVQLLSRAEREGAHAFYGSLGFESSAVGFRRYLD